MYRTMSVAIVFGAVAAVAFPSATVAQSACTLPVAAYLTDSAGTPLEGEVSVELRFYVDEAADALPVECRSTSASLDDGWLRLLVEACAPPEFDDCGVIALASLFESSEAVWLGVTVGADDEELEPRQLLGAVPYAIRAARADDSLRAVHAESAGIASSLEGFDPSEYSTLSALSPVALSGTFEDLIEIPDGLADGDDDTLRTLDCGDAEVPIFDAEAGLWICGDAAYAEDAGMLGGRTPAEFASTDDLDAHIAAHGAPVGIPSSIVMSSIGACVLVEGLPICWPSTGLFPRGAMYDVIEVRGSVACGIDAANVLQCFDTRSGYNLGREAVPAGSYTQVSVGSSICALTVAGAIVCWGGSSEELLDSPAGTFSAIDFGNSSRTACAAAVDGGVQCWGRLGAGGASDIIEGAPTEGVFGDIVVGQWFACALTIAGDEIVCWGDPSAVGGMSVGDGPFVSIAGDGDGLCALTTAGEVECWSDPTTFDWGSTRVPSGGGFTLLAAYGASGCAVHESGEVFCWGSGLPSITNVPFALRYR